MIPVPLLLCFQKELKQVKNLIERAEAKLDEWGAKLETEEHRVPC